MKHEFVLEAERDIETLDKEIANHQSSIEKMKMEIAKIKFLIEKAEKKKKIIQRNLSLLP